MELYQGFKFKFNYIATSFPHLDETEWTNMIKTFCINLSNKPVGDLLVRNLLKFISKGYKITISNNDYPINSTIYPKIRYISANSILIVIPSVPYFTYVDTISKDICADAIDSFIKNIEKVTKGFPSKYPLKFNDKHRDYSFLISKTKMTGFISFAHELIHALRYFENIGIEGTEEEDCTIYGLEGQTLQYDKTFITENAIRKEYGMDSRISHDCREIFCYNVRFTHKNEDMFSKEDYYKIC